MRPRKESTFPILVSATLALLTLIAVSLPQAAAQTLTCNGKPVTIRGTRGNDTLVGTAGPDVIHGLGGKDRISGLGGNDTICGGPGNDFIRTGTGSDVVDGGKGWDRVSYSQLSRPISTEASSEYPNRSAIAVRLGGSSGTAVQQLVDIEKVVGTRNDDVLNAPLSWTRGRVLAGLGGDDTLGSLAGAALGLKFFGNSGKDKAFIASEDATFIAGKDDDWFQCYTGCTAKMGPGNDALSNGYFTGSGPITVYLGSGDDQVYGRQPTRIVAYGGPGDDLFGGSQYNDTFYGGGGSDLFYGSGGRDKCFGGRGRDALGPDSTCSDIKSIEQRTS